MLSVGCYDRIGNVGWLTVFSVHQASDISRAYRQNIVAILLYIWLEAVCVRLIILWDVYSQMQIFVISILLAMDICFIDTQVRS